LPAIEEEKQYYNTIHSLNSLINYKIEELEELENNNPKI
jgi:hypothetical protein